MNSDRSRQIVPWESLAEPDRAQYLREADELVYLRADVASMAGITREEFDDAVLQTAREIYDGVHAAETLRIEPSVIGEPTIEHEVRTMSAVLKKRVFIYRDAAGQLVLAPGPLAQPAQLVAAFDNGRKIAWRPIGGSAPRASTPSR